MPLPLSCQQLSYDSGVSAPFVIGVAGGSGSGKTTVVRRIVDSLGGEQVSLLEHDRYYRDRNDLRLEERAALNYDHPDSLETDLLVHHVNELRAGRRIEKPEYDFARHQREPTTVAVEARRAIIVEGILLFTDPALRRLMDVKVFVDADDDTRFIRRLQRDIAERGRTVSSVIEQSRYGQADAPRVRRTEQALRRRHHSARRPQHGRHRHAPHADPQSRGTMTSGAPASHTSWCTPPASLTATR